jgi:DNA-binding transcriptional MocR family regulator
MIELIQKLVAPGSAVNLASQLEQLVRTGRVPAEAVLPPVRALATAVGVSPGTAAAAYAQLRRQGLVSTDGRRGTRVVARAQVEYGDPTAPKGTLDLMVANPDPALLPDLAPFFAKLDARSDSYAGDHTDPRLLLQLRTSFEADGVDASQVVVVNGALAALSRALRVSAAAGDRVAVEDPGFNDHHALVRTQAMVPVPVEIDHEGLLPDSLLAALRSGVRVLLATPRLQSPTGAAFTTSRAAALRRVLAGFPEVVVLFDDYAWQLADVAYHDVLGARPGDGRRWLVVRHLSKALGPDLRVAVAACDAETADRLRRDQWLNDGWLSIYLQRVAGAALANSAVREVVKRARLTYAARRSGLLRALAERGVDARGASGFNVWVPVTDEASAVGSLLQAGYSVRSGSRYRLRTPPAIRVTVAQLPEHRIEPLADAVLAAVRPGAARRGP